MSERGLVAALFGFALIATACSPSGTAANSQPTPAPAARSKPQGIAVSASKACANDNLHRSKCMIELILDDVEKEYGGIDGGGIDGITGLTSTSFAVSLPFEERRVTLTYEFDVKEGSVTIKGKTESTKSYGR